MHLDDVTVGAIPAAPPTLDSRGTNHGTYVNGPTLAVPGAVANDPDTAMELDGTGDHATVARQISTDLSVELWFRSQGGGANTGSQWWQAAGLVDASATGLAPDFGVGLRADGRVVAGVGWPDASITSPAAYDDGAWHHVVFTRSRLSGLMRLHVDGVAVASGIGIGGGSALDGSPNLTFGRIQSSGNGFTGALDEVAVYDTVLAPSTVLDHYQAAR
jgi:hypothetical protein